MVVEDIQAVHQNECLLAGLGSGKTLEKLPIEEGPWVAWVSGKTQETIGEVEDMTEETWFLDGQVSLVEVAVIMGKVGKNGMEEAWL